MKVSMLFGLLLLLMTAESQARCYNGDTARVVSSRYRFCSFQHGCRNASIGTQVRLTDVRYTRFGNNEILTSVSGMVVPAPKTLIDPDTGEAMSCTSFRMDEGMFQRGSDQFFLRFLDCQ